MAKYVLLILSTVVFLAGCAQSSYSEPVRKTTEVQSGYSFPDDIYEYCGEQIRSDGYPGFELYCFDDFQVMARCIDSDENQRKEYSNCDYDAHFSLKIDESQTNNSSDTLLTSLLVEKNPSKINLYNAPETFFTNLLKVSNPSTTIIILSEQENPNDAIIAEISFTESETTPTLFTVIPVGKDTFITIEGRSSDRSVKFLDAFEIFVSSIFVGDTSQFRQG